MEIRAQRTKENVQEEARKRLPEDWQRIEKAYKEEKKQADDAYKNAKKQAGDKQAKKDVDEIHKAAFALPNFLISRLNK